MSDEYTYKEVVAKAKEIQENIKTKYKTDVHNKWGYYCAKALLNPKKPVKKMDIASAPKPSGNYLSRQIKKASIEDIAEHIVEFAEKNKRMGNYVSYGKYNIRVRDYINMMSYCLIFQSNKGRLPNYYDINSKAFTKPTEDKNTVFKKWVNKFKFTPQYIDDVCDYILEHFNYLFYYDDQKSNAEVIDTKSGNCTDLLQMLINMAEAMGYEWKVIHTECKQSKVGHVYGMFRRKDVNQGEFFVRDIACIADESRYCVWCEVPDAGNQLAVNPNWFLQNLHR